jgi:Flp pilus assembly pilin Flp
MFYEMMGRAHAALAAMRDERGQGTVEYVGLILLIAVVLAGVVKAAHGFSDDKGIATTIVAKLKQAIGDVGKG